MEAITNGKKTKQTNKWNGKKPNKNDGYDFAKSGYDLLTDLG